MIIDASGYGNSQSRSGASIRFHVDVLPRDIHQQNNHSNTEAQIERLPFGNLVVMRCVPKLSQKAQCILRCFFMFSLTRIYLFRSISLFLCLGFELQHEFQINLCANSKGVRLGNLEL